MGIDVLEKSFAEKMFHVKHIAVAVSGGVDSMSLLHAVAKSGARFFVLHVEHGIRGEASEADCEFVKNYCEENGFEFCAFSVNAPEYAKENGLSLETAARILRHGVFKRVCEEKKCDAVALAHHKDDNAESLLMHILRGAGLDGLVGMKEEEGHILRPFLKFTRKEIEEYAEENKIPHISDLTNESLEYARNFVRLKLMPEIEKIYPDAKGALLNLSKNAVGAVSFIEKQTSNNIKTIENTVLLPKSDFSEESYINYLNIKKCLALLGVKTDVERAHYAAAEGLMRAGGGAKSVDLPHFVTAKRTKEGLVFFVERDKIAKKGRRV